MTENTEVWNVEFDCPQSQIDEMFVYLDDLRESGITNMFGAGPYVAEAYDINRTAAHKVLAAWMKTFEERHATPEPIHCPAGCTVPEHGHYPEPNDGCTITE